MFVDDSQPQVQDNLPAVRQPTESLMPVVAETRPEPPAAVSPPPAEPTAPRMPPAEEPGVLWSAVGQPITGIGAGRYKLTATMLYFERGVLSTNAQQVPIAHVADVDLRQSMTQKARGLGSVVVKVQRASGVELVVLDDLPDPRRAVAVINQTAQAARLVEQQRVNTHHYSGPPPTAPAPAAAASVVDPIAQLRQLGELRDAGILTEDEFATKKAEILARL
ncbi:PH domain-containing protein [Micromonospora sp. NPDC005215]|uniref:PH domain-containing protein n=1 Tax=Micromonospora sp. NPDC005215 TaxID=3157024 RepID=UPI0033A1838F